MSEHFSWHPDMSPPLIEAHSRAKLEVLRGYLRSYFDTLNVDPRIDTRKLDLIDGFCGGGAFRAGGEVVSGTPLIMLEEVAAASQRLNRDRTKPLSIDCKTYFVDKERAHTDHLRKVLDERGYRVDDERIVIRTGRFENELDRILRSVRQRQPRAGRAIFLLDQTGYSHVGLDLVARIFSELANAEVILTFSVDNLVNHFTLSPAFLKGVAPLRLTSEKIHELSEHRDSDDRRAIMQRVLRKHVRRITGAVYDTPFFVRPLQSRRALWLLHLSRHPTARDVMIQTHWDIKNTFVHYGAGGIDMLGWDHLRDSGTFPLFRFGAHDEQQMRDQLLAELPRLIHSSVLERPLHVDAFRRSFANQTAARYADLDEVVCTLVQEGEFDIVNSDGKRRSRCLMNLSGADRIVLPQAPILSGFSRLQGMT